MVSKKKVENDELTSSESEFETKSNDDAEASEDEYETAQEKRLRLAKIYLQEIEKEGTEIAHTERIHICLFCRKRTVE